MKLSAIGNLISNNNQPSDDRTASERLASIQNASFHSHQQAIRAEDYSDAAMPDSHRNELASHLGTIITTAAVLIAEHRLNIVDYDVTPPIPRRTLDEHLSYVNTMAHLGYLDHVTNSMDYPQDRPRWPRPLTRMIKEILALDHYHSLNLARHLVPGTPPAVTPK